MTPQHEPDRQRFTLPTTPVSVLDYSLSAGRVVFTHGYGLADIEARTPATPRTDYRLASLTKQFTAMAVMILAEQHRLAFDDSVSRYLPSRNH